LAFWLVDFGAINQKSIAVTQLTVAAQPRTFTGVSQLVSPVMITGLLKDND
jgi:hypothetical protein